MKRNGSSWFPLGGLIFLSLFAGACSCGSSEVWTQYPRLATTLERDPAEDADFVVDFGEVAIGAAGIRQVSLKNEGSVTLAVASSEPAAPFFLSPAAGTLQLPAGSSTEIGFRFEPLSESSTPFRQILTLSTNEGAEGSTYRIRLEGVGVRAALVCDPPSLEFGVIVRGNTSSRTVTCRNLASFPIQVGELAIGGASAQFFSARFAGTSNEVAPGGTIEFQVELRAESLGTHQALLEASAVFLQPLVTLPLAGEVVASEVSVEPAACLDFSYVKVGESARQHLTLRNLGRAPIQVLAIELEEESLRHFSVPTAVPLLLAPDGGAGTVEIDFHPSITGPLSTALSLLTDEAGAVPLVACAEGYGGGPALSCSPASLDFGQVAVGVPVASVLRCSNTGTKPEDGPEEPLLIGSANSDSDHFRVTLRNVDGSTQPKPSGYGIGEGFFLEVIYDPVDEGFDEGELRVETNSTTVHTRLSGQGRSLPPCEISITPPALQFGIIDRGEELKRSFEIRNQLGTACLIRDLRLSDASSQAYSLAPIDAFELEGDGAVVVPIRFAPAAYASSIRGQVEFEISNQDDRFHTVELSGAASQACLLIEPTAIDFGDVTPGCNNQGRKIVISNACAAPLTITSANIEGPQAGDFHVLQMPVFPRLLGPQDWVEATVAFIPNRLGPHTAALEFQVEEGALPDEHLYVASLVGTGTTSSRQTDEFIQQNRPAIDILWVIDNSSSMNPFQERIRENLPAFLTFANQREADFQIGVTSAALSFGGSGCPGGADGEENGRLFPVDGSHPRILRPNTRNLEDHWKHNMMVGTCWELFGESPMEAARRALSVPLINEAKDSRYPWSPHQDGNAGFLRPKAALSIILVGDEDYSPQTPADYASFFIGLKRGNRNMVRVHGITGPREFGPGQRCSTQAGDRPIDLIEATEGTWLNICTPTNDTEAWRSALEEMSGGVFNVADRLLLRSEPADSSGDGRKDEADIEVRVNGSLLPHIDPGSRRPIWNYDSGANAIFFEQRYLPAAGAKITATYDLECS